ncbi:MAG: spermidine/putrescine ABC transporter permease [Candidatus Aminicenantes bacterium RBG_16_63_16]|nr:MAG: spermidine/putrescine ABC transporter permease [Candidatus Aminicenantes bacterium RBG_16_63_16]
MRREARRRILEGAVSLPSVAWLSLFFAIPTLLVFAIALKPSNPYGGIGAGWTLANLKALAGPVYLPVALRTLWISLLSAAICLVLAVPTGYYLARVPAGRRNVLLMLIIVPFWTNFLVRVFAWKALLHPEGPVKKLLVIAGLVGPATPLLYNSAAVVLVTVYTYLPFTILPIYAAAEKFDFQLLEAARDLGAGRFQAFRRVFLPGIRTGLLTGLLFVLIPALGSYVVPDLVGGPGGELIGNKIAQRVFVDRNLPQASALSSLLILAVLAPLAAVLILGRRRGQSGTIVGTGS